MIVGAWRWPQYEDAFAKGLRKHGAEVVAIPTVPFFECFLGRYQLALPVPGMALMRLNSNVVAVAAQHRPDWILFWRPTHILPGTLGKLRTMGIRMASYNNDDPFGPKVHGSVPWHHHWLWCWYLKCLPHFDRNFFYRRINCAEAKAIGATHAEVLMPYFIPWQDRPVELTPRERNRFETDVVFVGHYEPDGRAHAVNQLVRDGRHVKIWSGASWRDALITEYYQINGPIEIALGTDYAKSLCGARICLAFLSKLNRDTYTRRCFEIPACGKLMLAERTDDLLRMFKEDEEACFFSSNEELVDKARWLIDNPDIRERIAQAGMRRVWADGHDVMSRARQFLELLTPTYN